MASRFQLANSIREASVGDSIMADIEASIKSSGSASTGKGAATAARYLADTDDKVSTMKRRALGARTDAGINPEEDTFVLDKLSGLARDWMTSQLGDDDSTKDDNKKKLSDLISEKAAAPLDENTSVDEIFLRTGKLIDKPPLDTTDRDAAIDAALQEAIGTDTSLTQDPDSITTDAERAEDAQSGSGVSIDARFPDDVTTTPATTSLMSRKSERSVSFSPIEEAKKYNKQFSSDLVDDMLDLEGMGGDNLTSVPTYSFGIRESVADAYGLEPSQFNTMREFADAFSEKYTAEKKKKYKKIFGSVEEKYHLGMMSYLWNAGSFGPGQKAALNSGDMSEFISELRDAVGTEGHSSSGLSARRAKEANLIGANLPEAAGWEPITEVKITGTRAKPVFDWLDRNGNVVESYSATKSLHPGNLPNERTTLDNSINI